jgi:hypothetical protein
LLFTEFSGFLLPASAGTCFAGMTVCSAENSPTAQLVDWVDSLIQFLGMIDTDCIRNKNIVQELFLILNPKSGI